MIKYTKDLWKKIMNLSLTKKIILCFGVVFYIGIILVCTISFEFNYTSPGTLNRVNSVISINDKEIANNFYTVSVYSETKSCSLLEYWLRKIDPKQDIETKEEYEKDNLFTYNEEVKAGEAQKEQSIQDSIIVAYEIAKEDGYDVELKKEYKGVKVCYMPMNYLGIGPESIQIKDVITKIGDTVIDSMDTFVSIVGDIYYNETFREKDYKTPVIEIDRQGDEIILDTCSPYCLAYLGSFYDIAIKAATKYEMSSYKDYIVNYMFDYYELDTENSKPKFTINDAVSIGPSGGLCQTLYVYNALTDNSLIKENELITATGTIAIDGTIGSIGSVDKKVYTIDIYMSKYFFVPAANYEKAMNAYNTLSNPDFEIVAVTNARDAIHFLKEAGN